MGLTVSAFVTSDEDYLGAFGPFEVGTNWWAEVAPTVAHLREALGVPVMVLRLLRVEHGEGGRDGHVTYHVEAAERPAPGLLTDRPADLAELRGNEELRSPWARTDGLRELLGWATDALAAAGRPVNGPIEQHKTWNLAGLFRLPTARGPAWLKATPGFAADEASTIAAYARVDPGLVPVVIAAGEGRVLLEHLPGEDCWTPTEEMVTSAVPRFVAAQAALAGARPAGLRDWRTPVIAERFAALLDGEVGAELTAGELAGARALAARWPRLADCGLPDTVVHGDFHSGNWRSDGGPPVVVDFADAHYGNPVLDGLRVCDFLPEAARPAAAKAWVEAWSAAVPGSDPARALDVAGPLAHLVYAVRYQEFLDGIEPTERIYHVGDPATVIRAALLIS